MPVSALPRTAVVLVLLLCLTLPPSSQAHQLSSDTVVASEGYFVLQWALDAGADDSLFVLEQADNPGFDDARRHDIAQEGQMTITGLPDGNYYFRVGRQTSATDWSDTTQVSVAHPSLGRALAFFSLGMALFALLVVTIIRGNRRHDLDHPVTEHD